MGHDCKVHTMQLPYRRDPQPLLEAALQQWGGQQDLWLFGYASLIWRPEFTYTERLAARVPGWHRALRMWSRVNRGTPECPGLVFALLPGGCCRGVAFRIPRQDGHAVLTRLWDREMPTGVYDPRWLPCDTEAGRLRALGFTLSRHSPNYTGHLPPGEYRRILRDAHGRYGSTRDYAVQTLQSLEREGIHDRALRSLLHNAGCALE